MGSPLQALLLIIFVQSRQFYLVYPLKINWHDALTV
jgi:hypothetical protein